MESAYIGESVVCACDLARNNAGMASRVEGYLANTAFLDGHESENIGWLREETKKFDDERFCTSRTDPNSNKSMFFRGYPCILRYQREVSESGVPFRLIQI